MLNSIVVLTVCFIGGTIAQNTYINWLHQLQSKHKVLRVPETTSYQSLQHLQVPLDIEISTDSIYNQCKPDKGPYCYPGEKDTSNGDCLAIECYNVTCKYDSNQPLDSYEVEVKWNGSISDISIPACGLESTETSLTFKNPVLSGNHTTTQCPEDVNVQPQIQLSLADGVSGFTLSFLVNPTQEILSSSEP